VATQVYQYTRALRPQVFVEKERLGNLSYVV
jgi:hypothetical protein